MDAQRELTPTEKKLTKFRARVEEMKNISAVDAMKNYIFPLLAAMAEDIGNLGMEVEALSSEPDGSETVELLQDTLGMLLKLSQFADTVLVLGGFYVVKDGVLKKTEKAQADLHKQYKDLTQDVAAIIGDIQAELNEYTADDGDEDADEVDADGASGGAEGASDVPALVAATVATEPLVASEPLVAGPDAKHVTADAFVQTGDAPADPVVVDTKGV